nr:MAG TPA: hypothetical protein [Caudoviricetes sp.]
MIVDVLAEDMGTLLVFLFIRLLLDIVLVSISVEFSFNPTIDCRRNLCVPGVYLLTVSRRIATSVVLKSVIL